MCYVETRNLYILPYLVSKFLLCYLRENGKNILEIKMRMKTRQHNALKLRTNFLQITRPTRVE